MRVPDISATAGYAANVFNPISIRHETESTNPLFPALGNEHIKFDHRSPTDIAAATSLFYRDTPPSTNYASTADEFVQKALSSTPNTEYSTSFALNDNLAHYCCGAIPKKLIDKSTEDCDEEANTSGNTYKSFKEIFNTNRTFYEDCVRDFENINLLKNGVEHHANNADVDAIENLNSQDTPNSNNESAQYRDRNPFDNDFNDYSVTKCKHLEEQQQRDLVDKNEIYQDSAAEDQQIEDDNDYDDHSMLDLSSETKSNYDSDEKDEEFLTSASSSNVSVHTQKHSFFPRGIINPNYPGFQHLAHTLSEHFVTSSPSDSYDSEMSEYEMDLSADSFDSITEDKPQIELNNFNNNTTQSITMNPAGHLSNRHENFDYIHEEDDELNLVECEKDHHSSFADDHVNRNSQHSDNNPFNINDLEDGVQSKLTLLETDEGKESYDSKNASKDQMQVYITPDILIKNYHMQLESQMKKENRPDLLRGVSPHGSKEPLEIQQPCHSGYTSARQSDVKDEMSFGLTPVDIIGDFGQEVEREFGLLVSGYRRLVDTQDNMNAPMEDVDKVSDAILSVAKDQIDSRKYFEAFNKQTEETQKPQILPDLADDNAVDLPMTSLESPESSPKKCDPLSIGNLNHSSSSIPSDNRLITKYQKSSYDDRQLPPVAIEYKRCQQNSRVTKKSTTHNDKTAKVVKSSHSKPSIASRLFHSKRSNKSDKSDSGSNRKREEAELHKYQQLISDKEEILSNSKYAKLSSWAQHLKNSVKDRGTRNSTDLISPSALEQFDAYKIGTEVDMDQLQQHLKMAKEIERQRRNDREEIRRRLAMGAEENCNEQQTHSHWKANTQTRLQNGMSSDNESHSSDSETCPKLSKSKTQSSISTFGAPPTAATGTTSTPAQSTDNTQLHPYHGRPLSISSSNNIINNNTTASSKDLQQQISAANYSNEDLECDFFTKQAKLQIEARMALAQAKEMAHMQMEIERQTQSISPITAIIRGSLEKIGVQMSADKRRVSRQMLTEMNIAQLQVLVNNLHTHIEELNESLVNYLMERDDLHDGQDAMLVDIEELTRYIGAKEHIAQQERHAIALNKCSK